MHRHQTLEGFEVQALVAHHQVVALDQREAQVARQVGMFKIGFVVRPGREQRNVRVGTGWAHAFEAFHQRAVGAGQALHRQGLKGLGELAGDGQAVFQQIAQAGGRLATLAHHPPVAVRATGQVKCGQVQMGAAHRLHALHGPQITRVALHQRRWQQPFGEQLLRPVNIGHHTVEQAHALQHAAFNLQPTVGFNEQRKEVQRPGALRSVFVGVNVVGDAVVTNLARQAGHALVQVGGAAAFELLKKLAPGRRQGGLRASAGWRGGRGRGTQQLVKRPSRSRAGERAQGLIIRLIARLRHRFGAAGFSRRRGGVFH